MNFHFTNRFPQKSAAASCPPEVLSWNFVSAFIGLFITLKLHSRARSLIERGLSMKFCWHNTLRNRAKNKFSCAFATADIFKMYDYISHYHTENFKGEWTVAWIYEWNSSCCGAFPISLIWGSSLCHLIQYLAVFLTIVFKPYVIVEQNSGYWCRNVSFCVLRWFYRIPVPIPRVVRKRRRGCGGAAHGSAFLEDLLELIQRFQLIWRRLQRRRGVGAVRFVARPWRGPRVPCWDHPLLVPGQRRQQRGQRIPPKASNPGERAYSNFEIWLSSVGKCLEITFHDCFGNCFSRNDKILLRL